MNSEVDVMSNDAPLSIGAVAALFGLTPATLRWWERQGVLPPPSRRGGRRDYRPIDLRRIGLAYLCCVTGRMPLARAAVVTGGVARHEQWQRTVGDQITQLDRQIEELRASRAYLEHLLCCEHDDVAQCSFLDRDFLAHLPLVRDETAPNRDKKGTPSCAVCGVPIPRSARGRVRVYCSQPCRQQAYRSRRAAADSDQRPAATPSE